MNNYLIFGCGLLAVVSSIFEVHSNFVRAKVSFYSQSRYLGYAAWMQYVARIVIVLSTSILTVTYEIGNFTNFKIYINIVSIFSIILMIFYILSHRFANCFMTVTKIFSFHNYKIESQKNYWDNISSYDVKYVLFAMVLYFFLIISSYLPFLLSVSNPDYRMSFATLGQLLNFFGTALMISIIEPAYLSQVDKKNEKTLSHSLAIGRVFAQLIVIFIVNTII